jgi:hypothetical protein
MAAGQIARYLEHEEYEAAVYNMTLLQYMRQETSPLEQVKIP